MLTLTPLTEINAFDETIRAKLADYWITTAEEFVTTARSGNQQFGSGQAAFREALNLSEAEIKTLVDAARTVLPLDTAFGVGPQPELGTGVIFEDLDLPDETAFDLPHELPDEVSLLDEFSVPPQQQGKRDTCLAFALIALYQHATSDPTDLSEQFLYWACKERDGIPLVRGTRPDAAFDVLRDLGVCLESTWPYQSAVLPGEEGQGPPPDGAVEEARRRVITSYSCLPGRDHRQIMASLTRGKPVLIGMPIKEHWTNAWQARTLGRVRRSLPGEADRGGHAMVVMGYRHDAMAPGGGYFIVRNSWGTTWGTQNPDGPGYCHMPFKLVFEQNLISCAIESLPPPPEPTSDGRVGEHVGFETRPRRPALAQPAPGSAHPEDEIATLYYEARSLRDQMNDLVERLGMLLQRVKR